MRMALAVFLLTGVALAAAGFMLYRYASGYPDRPAHDSAKAVTVVVPRGSAFPKVVRLLHQAGAISNKLAFRIYANYKGVASKVRAGTYKLNTNVTPRRLLHVLVHGVAAPTVTVTIPEGKNMLEVAEILAAKNIAPRDALVAQMRNRRLLRRLGVPGGRTMEGFLFPDTYRLRAQSPPSEVLRTLFRRHKRVFVRLRRKHVKGFHWLRERLRWGHYEIVTLASIVEKETGKAEERPRIARVFLNRLTFPRFGRKLLQTDPTIIYGCTVPQRKSPACRKFHDRIRRIQLDDKDNPYNTYQHPGLPPGPIANPGRAALEAVLVPEKSRYLYFVSKNDGSHYFSATRAEHERAVDRYQRGK